LSNHRAAGYPNPKKWGDSGGRDQRAILSLSYKGRRVAGPV
jgi:hypothetical protein